MRRNRKAFSTFHAHRCISLSSVLGTEEYQIEVKLAAQSFARSSRNLLRVASVARRFLFLQLSLHRKKPITFSLNRSPGVGMHTTAVNFLRIGL